MVGTAFSGKISFSGQIPLCRQRGRLLQRLWHQGRKDFICRSCCSPPEVTGGVILLFNGPELIPFKQFCCCQEFIWLCWSHFHEEQRKGLGSAVAEELCTAAGAAGASIHNPHFSSPHYNVEKRKISPFVQDSVW